MIKVLPVCWPFFRRSPLQTMFDSHCTPMNTLLSVCYVFRRYSLLSRVVVDVHRISNTTGYHHSDESTNNRHNESSGRQTSLLFDSSTGSVRLRRATTVWSTVYFRAKRILVLISSSFEQPAKIYPDNQDSRIVLTWEDERDNVWIVWDQL